MEVTNLVVEDMAVGMEVGTLVVMGDMEGTDHSTMTILDQCDVTGALDCLSALKLGCTGIGEGNIVVM